MKRRRGAQAHCGDHCFCRHAQNVSGLLAGLHAKVPGLESGAVLELVRELVLDS